MIWFSIAIAIFFIEYKLKTYFEHTLQAGQSTEKWKGYIIFNKYHNKGAALDIMERHSKILIGITSVMLLGVSMFLIWLCKEKGKKLQKMALAFILGGGFSNLWDRITKKYVVDYFSFSWKKIRHIVFNIADFCIFIGIFLLSILSIRTKD